MSDLFLMLAQTAAGLSCFAVPRWRPDGTRNAIRIERLKDKLGNRSNASSEIELDGAWGTLLGDEGAGVATIIRMVNHTRLDCVIGVTGQMRAGLTQAIHHTRHRAAFGRLPRRPAADAPGARRPRRRERGGDADDAAPRRRLRRRRRARSAAWPPPSASTGAASARRCSPPRRWSASAATATSRPGRWPGCSGRARSTASGRAAAT